MRFVILRHWLVGSIHWDLLLQQPFARLRTWSFRDHPFEPGQRPVRLLTPHRELYLVYQGPVSSMRGRVDRWDKGTYRMMSDESNFVCILLRGGLGSGTLELRRVRADQWQGRFQLALGA